VTDQDDERRAQGEALLEAIQQQGVRDKEMRDRLYAVLAELRNNNDKESR